MTVLAYVAAKDPLQGKRSVLAIRIVSADTHPGASSVADLSTSVYGRLREDSLSAVAAEMTTRPNKGATCIGKR